MDGARIYKTRLPLRIFAPVSLAGLLPVTFLYVQAGTELARIEALCGVPIDLISTGPDREETIVLRHPFRAS